MIVHEADAPHKVCPVMSYRSDTQGERKCRASSCMAWRPIKGGYGFCGMFNPARDHGTPDEQSVKQSIQSHPSPKALPSAGA